MSITTPTISEAAAEFVVVGFGQAGLDALVAADVNDRLADVIEPNEQRSQFLHDLRVPTEATVAQFVELIETNLVRTGTNTNALDVGGLPAELSGTAAPIGSGVVVEKVEASEDNTDTDSDLGDGVDEGDQDDDAAGELVVPEWASKLDTTGQVFKATFDKYADEMAPRRPQTTASLVRNQKVLLRCMIGVINATSGDNFHNLFNYMLQRFNAERTGVFNERSYLRGIDKHQFNPDEINLFPRLLNMFRLLSDPQSRQVAMRQISLEKTLATPLITEEGRRRVYQFFGQ